MIVFFSGFMPLSFFSSWVASLSYFSTSVTWATRLDLVCPGVLWFLGFSLFCTICVVDAEPFSRALLLGIFLVPVSSHMARFCIWRLFCRLWGRLDERRYLDSILAFILWLRLTCNGGGRLVILGGSLQRLWMSFFFLVSLRFLFRHLPFDLFSFLGRYPTVFTETGHTTILKHLVGFYFLYFVYLLVLSLLFSNHFVTLVSYKIEIDRQWGVCLIQTHVDNFDVPSQDRWLSRDKLSGV